MNLYDKEVRIISKFQDLKIKDIRLFPINLKTLLVYRTIHNKRIWKQWIDTSSKKEPPPDFYNNKLKLMIDVMRIDDHSYINEKGRIINRHNERESKLIKELIGKNKVFKEILERGNLHITTYSGVVGREDHNYSLYVSNFKRVVEKHINKIKQYQQNHPGFKTVFVIFDESTPYMKLIDCEPPKQVGDLMHGDLHSWWKDSNMLNIIKDSNIDYLIWMTPFKLFNSMQSVRYPLAVIYEVSKINFDKNIQYGIDELESMEM